MPSKGKIISWNNEKGFGFIQPNSSDKQLFVHIKNFKNTKRSPSIGKMITYTLSLDRQGRSCAENVMVEGYKLSKDKNYRSSSLSILASLIFFVIVSIAIMLGKLPALILLAYATISLLTFIIYAIDKSAAQKDGWRIKESTLHLLSLIGGWPGALIAQEKLRHKSKKQSFRSVFWATVFINIGTFIWFLSPNGVEKLEYFIHHLV